VPVQSDSDEGAADGPIDDVSLTLTELYRGERDRVTTWRGRLDQTTNWTVTIIAAMLTWVFSSPENPHYLLLIGMLVKCTPVTRRATGSRSARGSFPGRSPEPRWERGRQKM
jgi:uncharacterized membrane protein